MGRKCKKETVQRKWEGNVKKKLYKENGKQM